MLCRRHCRGQSSAPPNAQTSQYMVAVMSRSQQYHSVSFHPENQSNGAGRRWLGTRGGRAQPSAAPHTCPYFVTDAEPLEHELIKIPPSDPALWRQRPATGSHEPHRKSDYFVRVRLEPVIGISVSSSYYAGSHRVCNFARETKKFLQSRTIPCAALRGSP